MPRHVFTGEECQRGGRIGYKVTVARYPEFGRKWLKKRIFKQYSAIKQQGGTTPRQAYYASLGYHGHQVPGALCPRCQEQEEQTA